MNERRKLIQVQPDLEELEANMESIDDSDSYKDEVQLGQLHFSMDYDFTKSEVFDKCSRCKSKKVQFLWFCGLLNTKFSNKPLKYHLVTSSQKPISSRLHLII